MKNGKLFYPCQSRSCDFVIWGEMSHRKIKEPEVKELLEHRKTPKLKGFKSKNNKSFEASLKIENNKVVFDFPSKDKQKGGEK